MRISHSIAAVENEAAGTTVVVWQLAEHAQASGHPTKILSIGGDNVERNRRFELIDCSWDYKSVPGLSRYRFSKSMAKKFELNSMGADIYHSHGMWLMPNMYPALKKSVNSPPVVHTPHGTISDWALNFSKWKKRFTWAAAQKRAFLKADLMHATSNQEAEDIRKLGFKGPIAVIPNGIEIPGSEIRQPHSNSGSRTLLYLGRIHPKKGLSDLIEAWSLVREKHKDWQLKIVGPDEIGHRAELEILTKKLNAVDVSFHEPIYGGEKYQVLASADLFVLPTHSENFGIAVGESLAAGTPVVCTKGAPWPQLLEYDCGWWVDVGVKGVSVALDGAMTLSPQVLREKGKNGRALIEHKFGWPEVSDRFISMYEWLLGDRRTTHPDIFLG